MIPNLLKENETSIIKQINTKNLSMPLSAKDFILGGEFSEARIAPLQDPILITWRIFLSIREKMMATKNRETGERTCNKATTFFLLIFYVPHMQCITTLAIIYSETITIKWPIVKVVYMAALTYSPKLMTYTFFS